MDPVTLALATQRARGLAVATRFPAYSSTGVYEVLHPVADIDMWDVVLENPGDSITVVDQVDTSAFPDEAKGLINPLPVMGASKCLKMYGGNKTRVRGAFDEPVSIGPDEDFGLMLYFDTLSGDTPDAGSNYVKLLLFSNWNGARNSYYETIYYKGQKDDGWFLFTLPPKEITSKVTVSPSWDHIDGLAVELGVQGSEKLRVYVGPLVKFKSRAPQRGAVIIDFDDGYESTFTEAYRYMTGEYGYRGNVNICGKSIEAGLHPWYAGPFGQLPAGSVDQFLRMQEDGWTVANHTWSHPSGQPVHGGNYLTDLPYGGQEDEIIRNAEWMARNGFWYGSQVFVNPNYRSDYRTKAILRKHGFRLNRFDQRTHNNPANPTRLPYYDVRCLERSEATTLEDWKASLQVAQDHKTISLNVFHHIGTTGYAPTSQAKFRQLIDEIQNYDVDVITYADLLSGEWPKQL